MNYEGNLRLIDILVFRHVFSMSIVDRCSIEDCGLAMLMGHVRSFIEAYWRLNLRS